MFFRVNMRVQNRGEEKEIFFVMETDHDDLSGVNEALLRDGQVYGTRLDVRSCGPRARRIESETEFILMKGPGLMSVSELTDDLYDADGEPVYVYGPAHGGQGVGGYA